MLKLKSMDIKAEHDLLTYLTLCGFWGEKKKGLLSTNIMYSRCFNSYNHSCSL